MGNQKAAWQQSSGQEDQDASHEMAFSWQLGYVADPQRLDREYHDGSVQSTLAELVGALVRGAGIEEMLTKLTSASVALVPGAEFADISLISNGHLRSIAATSESIALLDGAQQAAGQGPCLDAVHTQNPIRCSTPVIRKFAYRFTSKNHGKRFSASPMKNIVAPRRTTCHIKLRRELFSTFVRPS